MGRRTARDKVFRPRVSGHPSNSQKLCALAGCRYQSKDQLATRSSAGDKTPAFKEIKPYIGPFPPHGTHDYEFTVYALRIDSLDVPHGASLEEFTQAAQRESLAAATLIGKFTKTR